MLFVFSHKGQCRVSMYDYVDSILEAFDDAVKKCNDGYLKVGKRRSKSSAAPDNLFVVDEDCEKLSDDVAASFHTIVAKVLYVTKQARPDTSLAIVFMTTRVRAPDTDDWEKLCHRMDLMEYLRGDHDRPLILSGDNEGELMWYVDAAFAVHPNMCGHTGGCMTMGLGFPISVSTKQKLNRE
jgi:hypothetical protein